MNVLTAALLGLIQGLAEFLPISSSGHLNLLQALFGVDVEHQLLFNILLHVGTLVAVAIVFWKDWVAMIAHPIKNHTLVLLFIASLPALAGKILFDKPLDYVETHNSLLGVCFLITALLLVLTQWLSRRNALRGVEKHRPPELSSVEGNPSQEESDCQGIEALKEVAMEQGKKQRGGAQGKTISPGAQPVQ